MAAQDYYVNRYHLDARTVEFDLSRALFFLLYVDENGYIVVVTFCEIRQPQVVVRRSFVASSPLGGSRAVGKTWRQEKHTTSTTRFILVRTGSTNAVGEAEGGQLHLKNLFSQKCDNS